MKTLLALVTALLVVTTAAVAQHAHDGNSTKPIGKYEVELSLSGDQIILTVFGENEEKVDTSMLQGTATVLAENNQPKTLALMPAGGNTLSAALDFSIPEKLRATIALNDAAGEIGKARFSIDR